MTDLSTDTEPTEEVEPDVTYALSAFRFGVGTADFDAEGGVSTEPVVLFDAVLVDTEGHDTNARIVLAGATSALVAEEAEASATMLLQLILAAAGAQDNDNPEADPAA